MQAHKCPGCDRKHYGFWSLCGVCQRRVHADNAARAVAEAMEASTAACVLMDRYQLVLQRTQNVTALVGHHVRAIGPGPAGQPSAWFETTAEAVADWVAKHGPTYTPASGRETWFRAPETWIRVEPRPLEVPATSGYCHPVDQADGQGARG